MQTKIELTDLLEIVERQTELLSCDHVADMRRKYVSRVRATLAQPHCDRIEDHIRKKLIEMLVNPDCFDGSIVL